MAQNVCDMKLATKPQPKKRGTKPKILKLNGSWQEAIKKSFQ